MINEIKGVQNLRNLQVPGMWMMSLITQKKMSNAINIVGRNAQIKVHKSPWDMSSQVALCNNSSYMEPQPGLRRQELEARIEINHQCLKN